MSFHRIHSMIWLGVLLIVQNSNAFLLNTRTRAFTTTTVTKTSHKAQPSMMSKTNERLDRFKDYMPQASGELDLDPPEYPVELDPTLPEVLTIVKAGDMRKAQNIKAIRVSSLTVQMSFLVVMSGTSRPQNQAISRAIVDDMEEVHGLRPREPHEGTADSGWMLLDYGDIVVHIMTPKSRAFYDIEGFWGKGEPVDLSGVVLPNTAAETADSQEPADPFWS
uniref:Ribosomal silencing factor RsfS n=1 Tax=Fibrocapsa japonica TaxID=94617 RepID=A0A7S2Y0E5_9STRA|mmetsp:Transcript_4987/g.7565  ORF Transcript_4987/g.7565 Transcript_4987/m.7565 type:complete len:221 (+) Transcript_4987:75-737(+)